MTRTIVALMLLCALLRTATSQPHEERKLASEASQTEVLIKRQETGEETATPEQPSAEGSSAGGETAEPTAEQTGPTESKPTEGETGTDAGSSPTETAEGGNGTPTSSNEPNGGGTETSTGQETGSPSGEETGSPTGEETGSTSGEETKPPTGESSGEETKPPTGESSGEETKPPTEESSGEEAGASAAAPTEEAEPSIINKEYNANEATDYLITLTINHPPSDLSTIRFQEGDGPKVGIGESTVSFEFREGTIQEDGMLEIPVYVKDQTETKQITFTVELNGNPTTIKVNVETAGPAFKVLQNRVKASEQTQWKFILKIQAKGMLNYTFTEGDQDTFPTGETKSLRFGDLTHVAEGNMDQIEVTVIDLSKNNVTFDVSSNNTTETVTVEIEPPTKPMLLKTKFAVGKSNNNTFTLEIKAKSIPKVLFKDGDKEVSPDGSTENFVFGTMTNDEANLYKITVKLPKNIKETKKFTVTLENEDVEVTVSPEEKSSALRSASATLACFLVPLLVMLL